MDILEQQVYLTLNINPPGKRKKIQTTNFDRLRVKSWTLTDPVMNTQGTSIPSVDTIDNSNPNNNPTDSVTALKT